MRNIFISIFIAIFMATLSGCDTIYRSRIKVTTFSNIGMDSTMFTELAGR